MYSNAPSPARHFLRCIIRLGMLPIAVIALTLAGIITLAGECAIAQELVPVSQRRAVSWGKSSRVPPKSAPSVQEDVGFDIDSLLPSPVQSPAMRMTGNQEEAMEGLAAPNDQDVETVDPRNSDNSFETGPIQTGRREVINQYYPDGEVQIRRYVIQDEIGNYLNDGSWQLFGRNKQVLARGEFREGLMDGPWERWHPAGSQGLFAELPYNQFQAPFRSQATFSRGKLDGQWTVYDRNGRKIHSISYREGRRQGRAIWYRTNGAIFREVDFREGTLHGLFAEYDENNKVTRKATYDDGQELITRKTYFHKNQMKDEKNFLGPIMEFVGEDDWWNAVPAPYESTGEEVQHGVARQWYSNGQIRFKGQFDEGTEVGMFQWWHANGTKQTQGQYKDGLKHGLWAWWHANGRVAIKGEYMNGSESGEWTWFDESGRMEDMRNFVGPTGVDTNDSFDQRETLPSQMEDQAEDIGIGVPEEESAEQPSEGGSPGNEPDENLSGESDQDSFGRSEDTNTNG